MKLLKKKLNSRSQKKLGADKLYQTPHTGPPPIKMSYLRTLTDDIGVIQFSKHSTPDKSSGYTTDDNARALMVALKWHDMGGGAEAVGLAREYLEFVHRMQTEDGRLYNYLSHDRKFTRVGEETDCLGRVMWASGYLSTIENVDVGTKELSMRIFEKALPWSLTSPHLRIRGLALMGLYYYYKSYPRDDTLSCIKSLADGLVKSYRLSSDDDWKWYEGKLSYANPRLPHGLFLAYDLVGEKIYLDVAKESLDFLTDAETVKDTYAPIGNSNWYVRGMERALFDQEPLEASCMAQCALEAYRITEDSKYLRVAKRSFGWFLGENSLGISVYDEKTGGCHDGLRRHDVKPDQGAESTISYLLARMDIEDYIPRT